MAKTSLTKFVSQYPLLRYDKDQIIIHADDIPSGVFYIESGYVKMSGILDNGRELTLNIFKKGAFFPMIWAVTNIPNTYYFKTISETELRKVPRDLVLEFMKDNPDELLKFTKRILRSVKGLLLNIEHQLSGNSYYRVIAVLILAANRFGVHEKGNKVTIKLPLTHQEIADTAGITRETVSLVMAKLEKKKILSYDGYSLLINNLDKLNEESKMSEGDKPTPNVL